MTAQAKLERIVSQIDAIEEEFKRNAHPVENPAVLKRLRFQLRQISSLDNYIGEKAGEISELMGIFFSARRHATYPGGPDEVYSRIVHDLFGRIRQRAKNIFSGVAK